MKKCLSLLLLISLVVATGSILTPAANWFQWLKEQFQNASKKVGGAQGIQNKLKTYSESAYNHIKPTTQKAKKAISDFKTNTIQPRLEMIKKQIQKRREAKKIQSAQTSQNSTQTPTQPESFKHEFQHAEDAAREIEQFLRRYLSELHKVPGTEATMGHYSTDDHQEKEATQYEDEELENEEPIPKEDL
ncbi:hypothetical protein NEHOM01_1021 [Nematocida homosporus]|uniref:uncharacterized protein n=1 Tax=Nematocida homosporus TaxID=1912981 RepID=UPI00221FEBBE|nr:uncharacterized protein NEHOM01_1021 [Nematocida homosporus]KAI5185729.1 hypothetical protein NEHOM01_1021 [Nematocida homosporus]